MEMKRKALELHKQGLTTREIGKALGYSHEWVAKSVKLLSTIDKDLTSSDRGI